MKRGKFVLEQMLNTPPPPPPPELDIPELEDQKQLKGTLRQQMEQHRANPVCASCHQRMDPIGFAFENFDAVGAWREKDAGGAGRRVRRAARRPEVRRPGRAAEDPARRTRTCSCGASPRRC